MNCANRFVLGTAQLGMNYGIANASGKPDQKSATEIVSAAWEGGVREFDTAQGYGDSESVLGKAIDELNISGRVKIITKYSFNPKDGNWESLLEAVEKSLSRLKVPNIFQLMFHNENILELWTDELSAHLEFIRHSGLVEKIGVSVYSPLNALKALKIGVIDSIQIPSNIWDRRFEAARVFDCAGIYGKDVYVRSVFLQGLICMEKEAVPAKLDMVAPLIQKLDACCRMFNLTKQEIAAGYAILCYDKAQLVIGVESLDQLNSNLKLFNKQYPTSLIVEIQQQYQKVDDKILNPYLWG